MTKLASTARDNSTSTDLSRLDRFVSSRQSIALAFAWGLAEATVFFIVPDVLLTFIACRRLRPAVKATIAALVGALIGGAVLYLFGNRAPDGARAFLDQVPAIDVALIDRVGSQIDNQGLVAVIFGPLKGIPYKIYAVQWGSRGRSFISFLLISIPARYIRFLLATLAARMIARMIERGTNRRARIEVSILAAIWIAFYSFYFSRFGW